MNYWKSFLHALEGFGHALRTQRNAATFTIVYLASLLAGNILHIPLHDWPLLVFSGAAFLAVELLNTALEQFVDAFQSHTSKEDDWYYEHLKATKDVAAGASLVIVLGWIAVLAFTFLPYVPAFVL